mgnify:FL=1
MAKKAIGRPKKPEAEKKITLRIAVKRKHRKEVEKALKTMEAFYAAT